MCRIFIAGPFSAARQFDGRVRDDVFMAVETVASECQDRSVTYFSSHQLEEYGRVHLTEASLAERDVRAMKAIDVFVLLWWQDLDSPGSLIELGMAISSARPCHWIDVKGSSKGLSEYVDGLVDLGLVIRWNGNGPTFPSIVAEMLDTIPTVLQPDRQPAT